MISIISVITEQIMTKGRGINSHIHLNILELPAEMVIQNLSDYWSFLLYGHSPYLTVFALAYGITKFKKSFVDVQYIIVLAILFFAITALMKWSPGLLVLACLVLGLSFFVTENWQGKLWTFWIVLGLSQTMFLGYSYYRRALKPVYPRIFRRLRPAHRIWLVVPFGLYKNML